MGQAPNWAVPGTVAVCTKVKVGHRGQMKVKGHDNEIFCLGIFIYMLVDKKLRILKYYL